MKSPTEYIHGKGPICSCIVIVAILIICYSQKVGLVKPQESSVSHSVLSNDAERNTIPAASFKMEQKSNFDMPVQSEESVPVSKAPDKVEQQVTKYYDVPLSTNLQDLIFSECESKNVSSDLVIALIDVESNFNPKCISKTNDYGLMQINICHKNSLRKELQVTDLLDEKQNIKAGVHMLSEIENKYSNVNQALMVYNCGETGAKKLWNKGIYSTAYSRKIIAKIHEIKR